MNNKNIINNISTNKVKEKYKIWKNLVILIVEVKFQEENISNKQVIKIEIKTKKKKFIEKLRFSM